MLGLLANKLSALALGALEDGPRRFGALRARLEGVSPKVLTATLRRLGRDANVPLAAMRSWVVGNIERFPG